MRLIQELKKRRRYFISDVNLKNNKKIFKNFGPYVALQLLGANIVDILMGYKTSFYRKWIEKFCSNEFSELISKYRNLGCAEHYQPSKLNIWVFWWQGYEEAPRIVKKCIDSQKKYLIDENTEYHLITRNNLNDFITFPKFIMRKVSEKKITLTHLSDIIRVKLLHDYGGVWLDATIYMTSFLEDDFYMFPFYTNKKTFYETNMNRLVSKGRWTSYFLKSEKNNVLMMFMYDAFISYWEKYDCLIDYWLVDYVINVAYNEIDFIKKIIDKVPENNERIFDLFTMRNQAYNEDEYNKIICNTHIHKLSYKDTYYAKDKNGKNTYYSVILG